jgi:hypothetical protein
MNLGEGKQPLLEDLVSGKDGQLKKSLSWILESLSPFLLPPSLPRGTLLGRVVEVLSFCSELIS